MSLERNVITPQEAAELKVRGRQVMAQILLGIINGGLSYFAYKHGMPLEGILPAAGAVLGLARGIYKANELTTVSLKYEGVYPELPATGSGSRFRRKHLKRETDDYSGVRGTDPHNFESGKKKDDE